ncbi:MAG TPA: GNAT family N-acetyltransferase [Acidimicrobiales bacterium]|nr:GNAT family N-acetyltransferase [Acidimicrobiales bacterium]
MPDGGEAAPLRLPDRLESDGLLLGRWQPSDAAAVRENLEHLRPWMPWIALEPLSAADRLALIEGWTTNWEGGGDVTLAILRGAEVVGGTGLHRRRGPHGLEVGYWVDHRHLRQGIATTAARLLTAAALERPGIEFVEIHHDEANTASAAVPRRLGFAFIGTTPDTPVAPGEVGIDWTCRMTGSRWREGGLPSLTVAAGQ